jgi:hypothetical protein
MNPDDITTCLTSMMVGTYAACILLLTYWEVKDR